MKYVIVTHVDADTKIPCTEAPMRTGPSFPELAGLNLVFDDHSRWPLSVIDGIYDKPPHFYGTCDDTADTTLAGVLGVITEAEFLVAQATEEMTIIVMRLSDQVQGRLDRFAATRGYDNIMSACTYATSTSKYGDEGRYCVSAREATWDAMFAGLAEIEAGTRSMPTSYAEIEPLLPVLEWPQ